MPDLNLPAWPVFAGIDWGTAQVMAQTRARLRRLGWRWAEAEALWDVDLPQDLARLLAAGLLDAEPARPTLGTTAARSDEMNAFAADRSSHGDSLQS